MRLVVTGATGRMGREVIDAARADHDVLGVSHSSTGEYAGVGIKPATEFSSVLVDREPDAVIDFTLPEPSVSCVTDCAETGVPAVVGTTGFSAEQFAELREEAERIPVLQAANFARGVQGLLAVVREAVAPLPEYDIEVTETHHNGKRDAPSGTANRVLDAIDDVRGDAPRIHGREGEAPREAGEIGVHARRAGDVTGEHEVLLAGNHEELRLTHRAGSGGVFAAGAVAAAEWLAGRPPGWYDFSETLPDGES